MAATKTKSAGPRSAVYVAIGAGELAIEKARTLPSRAVGTARELPQQVVNLGLGVASQVGERVSDLRRIETLAINPTTVGKLVHETRERAAATATTTRERTAKLYQDLSKRGEKLAKTVQRKPATKKAVAQTKQARSRVKGASTSVRKAAKADAGAVKAAASEAARQTG